MDFLKGEVAVNKAVKTVLPLLAVAVLCVVPFVSNNYVLTVLTTIMTTALLGQSWNILSGYGGQFSFGQAIFYGIGAYTAVILYTKFGVTPWLGAIVGMGIAMLVGVIIGYLTFYCKIKGDYFALATLAFAEIFRLAVYNSTSSSMFGGPGGIFISYIHGGSFSAFQFSSWKTYYFIIFAILIVVTLGISKMQKTRYGLLLTSVRENELAASSLGVNVLGYKLSAIAISAAIASLAGTFYAQYYLFIDPSSVFGSTVSMEAIIPCIIGGSGTPFGPILGAFLIVPIKEVTNTLFSNIGGINMIIYGVLIVLFILFCPNGIIGIFKRLKAGRRKGGNG